MRIPSPTLAAAGAALLLCGCGSAASGGAATDAPPTSTSASAPASASASAPASASGPASPAPTAKPETAAAPGAYVSYAEYDKDRSSYGAGKVVYFFHATWCPSCRATEKAIATAGVPDGLTVVKVDFDSATDLRTKYGVTTQHTFVQVDGSGAELTKWTGSPDGAAILAETV